MGYTSAKKVRTTIPFIQPARIGIPINHFHLDIFFTFTTFVPCHFTRRRAFHYLMIHTIDLHFQDIPENIAAFLVETSAGPVLVESGPHATLPSLRAGAAQLGYQIEEIQHVFLTHIHLDHAGAAWWFAHRGATVYVHPRGSKHLAQPARLMASARRIYQDQMDTLWGQMNAIDSERIQEVAHGEIIAVGDVNFQAWHTPGHAVHHIAWQTDTALFTGDVAGVRINAGVVIPPCPPPDIDLADWHQSLVLLRSLNLKTLYLTHFGPVLYSDNHLVELEDRLQRWAAWMEPYLDDPRGVAGLTPLFQQMVMEDLAVAGVSLADQAKYEAANPSWMSVAGLLRYGQKKRIENGESGGG